MTKSSSKPQIAACLPHFLSSGGGGGIRTPETLSSLTVFKAGGCAPAPLHTNDNTRWRSAGSGRFGHEFQPIGIKTIAPSNTVRGELKCRVATFLHPSIQPFG